MRLVDATLPFQVVYSIYHHEYLGYLISSHVVQSLPNGELSLVHHRLLPENMNQFSKGLDDDDKKLIALTDSISPRQIIKKFHGNPRKEVEFFTTKFDGELKKLAMNLVQRQLAQIMAILSKKQVFEMGNDGYPAKKNISFLQEDATIWFHFRRKETFTRYYPTIKLKGETIKLTGKGAIIICEAFCL